MKIRMSSYNIYLDTDENRRTLVLNGMTGLAIRVEDSLLRTFSKYGLAPLRDNLLGEVRITSLLKSGIITDSTDEQELAFFRQQVRNIHSNTLRNAPSYTFLLGMDCNFSCGYCYQKSETSFNLNSKVFDLTMVDIFFQNLRTLEKNLRLPKNDQRSYTFIGGEPLLIINKPVIQYIMKCARDVGTSVFSAVSNASCLNQFTDILGPEGISSIQVTIDGPPEVHDKRRPTKGGDSTFSTISDNIDLALSLDVQINMRVNVDRNNLEALPALAREIVTRKWDKHNLFSAYLGLVQGKSYKDCELSASMLMEFLDDHILSCPELSVLSLPDVQSITALKQMVDGGLPLLSKFKSTYCYAHYNNVIIDPSGRIYTCLETDLSDEYLIGSIDENGTLTWSENGRSHWQDRTVANIEQCMRCAYALFCGGGCVVRAIEKNGDMYSPNCQDFKEFFNRMFQQKG
jgi:uncharacterized protein